MSKELWRITYVRWNKSEGEKTEEFVTATKLNSVLDYVKDRNEIENIEIIGITKEATVIADLKERKKI